MVFLREEKEKPGTFSFATMVFIFHQINSSLDSGCRQIPSLPARCRVCLRMWECVGVWVLFCFLHRLCRPSPALADRSLHKAQPCSIIRQGGLPTSPAAASCRATLLLQELLETWFAGIPALGVLQSCCRCQSLREGPCVEGKVPRLGAAECGHGCVRLGQGTGSTEQGPAQPPSERAPLTKGRNLPAHAGSK